MEEHKNGDMEELIEDLQDSGTFHSEEGTVPLETAIAKVRIDVDNALQQILAESQIPLFLFDYIVTSVLADIRKADLDMIRAGIMHMKDGE